MWSLSLLAVAALLVVSVASASESVFEKKEHENVKRIYPGERGELGKLVKLGEMPFAAYLHVPEEKGFLESGRFCSGALISSRYVLTAAHCVAGYSYPSFCLSESPQFLRVRLGIVDARDEALKKNPGLDIAVEKIIVHPRFDVSILTNDIALLRLAEEVKFNDKVRPIDMYFDPLPTATELIYAGWGLLTEYKGPETLYLRASGKPFTNESFPTLSWDDTDCVNLRYSQKECTYACSYTAVPGGPCAGDSGSSVLVMKDKRLYTVGLVSNGAPCHKGGAYGQTLLLGFEQWLKCVLNNNQNCDCTPCTKSTCKKTDVEFQSCYCSYDDNTRSGYKNCKRSCKDQNCSGIRECSAQCELDEQCISEDCRQKCYRKCGFDVCSLKCRNECATCYEGNKPPE